MKRGIVKLEEKDGKWFAYIIQCDAFGGCNVPVRVSEKFAKYYFSRVL